MKNGYAGFLLTITVTSEIMIDKSMIVKRSICEMAEIRYCYACHRNKKKDVKMEFYPGRSMYGTYECPECRRVVDKKTSGNTGEKYI